MRNTGIRAKLLGGVEGFPPRLRMGGGVTYNYKCFHPTQRSRGKSNQLGLHNFRVYDYAKYFRVMIFTAL
jgi:hypothetical protein